MRIKKAGPFAVVLGTLIIIFWPILLGNYTLYPSDILHELFLPFSASRSGTNVQVTSIIDYISGYYPMRHFLQQSLRSGSLPLWNPYIFGGHPAFASNGAMPSSDLFNIFLLLPNLPVALAWRTFLQLCASAIFMYIFLRHLHLRKIASLIGALAYTLNSMYYANIFDWALGGFLWLPLVLLLTDKAVETRRVKSVMFAGLSFGVCLLSSPLQPMAYIIFIFIGFYSLRFLFTEHRITKGSYFAILASILGLGLLLACVQLLPSAELFYLVGRGGAVSARTIPQAILATIALITFIFPAFGGQMKGGMLLAQAWGGETHSQGYIGFLPILLALIAVFCWPDRRKKPLIILALAAVLIALYTPLRSFVYDRFLLVYIFSTSMLAAYGTDAWLRGLLNQKSVHRLLKLAKYFLGFIAFSVLLGSVIFWIFEKSLREYAHTYLANFISGRFLGYNIPLHIQKLDTTINSLLITNPRMFIPLLIAIISVWLLYLSAKSGIPSKPISFVAVVLVVLDLGFSAVTHIPLIDIHKYPLFPTREPITLIKKDQDLFHVATLFRTGREAPIIYRSMLEPYGLQNIDGSDNVSSPWSLMNMVYKYGDCEYNICTDSQFLNLQNVKYLLTSNSIELPSEQFELIYNKEIKVYQNRQVMPRAYLLYSYEVIADTKELKEKLNSPDFNYKKIVLLEENPQIRMNRVMNTNNAQVKIVNYKPQLVDIHVSSSSPGFLLLADTYYPGWTATVDGKPTKVLRANFSMRAVSIPSGDHRVRFAFKPTTFRLGLLISACIFIFVLVSIVIDMARKPK